MITNSSDKRWERLGLCGKNPEIWCDEGRVTRVTARHVCLRHCPVLAQCADRYEEMIGTPKAFTSIVIAGLALDGLGQAVKLDGVRADCWICNPLIPPEMVLARIRPPDPTIRPGRLIVHGTDAAARRHRAAGEPLCEECKTAQRYRARRYRITRAQKKAAAAEAAQSEEVAS